MPAQMDALNYPYIRVRDVEWLKRTLLIFPHVARMTPFADAPADDPDITPFTKLEWRNRPLLRSADLWRPEIEAAQVELIDGLRDKLEGEDGQKFRRRFGRESNARQARGSIRHQTVWERRLSPVGSFQIHRHKLFGQLVEFLVEEGLAWTPNNWLADGPDYLEMSPALGEAVMATLATACAENEAMQLVTEFPELHGKLLATPRDKILSACIDPPRRSRIPSGDAIFEFLVYRRCEVDMLSAENILALKKEKDALADFRVKLEDFAKQLPPVLPGKAELQERFDDILADMFRDWKRDQDNLSAIARQFFGQGVLSEPGKVAQKLLDAALKEGPGTVAVGGFSGLGVHQLSGNTLVATGAGFVVALVVRGLESWGKARTAARSSPMRYLTALEAEGVRFSVGR
jgi:hypothetical protein